MMVDDQASNSEEHDSNEENKITEDNEPHHEEWLTKFCSHTAGSTLLLLPFAMARTGVILFTVLFCIEAYLSRKSLLYMAKMRLSQSETQEATKLNKEQKERESQTSNYFIVVGRYLPSRLRYLPHVIFSLDITLAATFYFKLVCVLYEYWIFDEGAPDNIRAGYHNQAFFAVASFILIYEMWERFQGSSTSQKVSEPHNTENETAMINCNINSLTLHQGGQTPPSANSSDMTDKINMEAVTKEMHHYAKRRPLLLLLCILVASQQFSILLNTWGSKELCNVHNYTELCSGLSSSISLTIASSSGWKVADDVLVAVSIIAFALMNYSNMLPVCTTGPRLSDELYFKTTGQAHALLTAFLTAFALMVYCTLGESTSPLFLLSYGRNVYGQVIVGLALAMAVVAMLLRFMACFKLVQVLFSNSDTENMYIVVVGIFFTLSFVITQFSTNVVQIAIATGSISSNMLMVIIPRLSFLSYLREQEKDRILTPEKISTVFVIFLHLCLLPVGLMFTANASIPDVNQGCRQVFSTFWQE